MNKSFIWIVGVLLLLSFVSAELQTIGTKGSINPFGNKKIILESITNEKINKDSFMLSEKSLNLPVVRISKTFLWVETDKIAEYKIIRNDVSIVNAETYGKAILYQNGKLFDDAEFKDLKGQLKEIVSYQYYIKQNISYVIQEPATYKTQCVKTNSTNLTKGSLLETCYEVVDTYKDVTKYKEEWVEYNYETLKSGEYEWLLKGQRKANTKVDFIPKAQGLSLDEYVWWNGDWQYKRQINLTNNVGNISYLATINYSDNMQSDFDDLRFIDCATESIEYNITRQAFVNATNSTWRIDTNGQNCVMMYYGNDAVNTTSSASNTYLNPVSYWTLDETSGTTAYDLLGVNNGTNNGATINQVGKIGTAYSFDGNDYVTIGDIYNANMTISVWVKYSSTATMGIISKDDIGYNREFTIQAYTGKIEMFIFTSGDMYGVNLGSVNNNNWRHIVLTYDGSILKGYLDGVLIDDEIAPGPIVNKANNLEFGRAQNNQRYYNGLLDEVVIYNRSLTQDEITQLYTQTMPTYTVGNEIQNAGFAVIDYITPPTPENNSNLSVNYIPVEVDVNYTNATLENITFDFYKGGVLNASYFYENETYFVNHSSCTCDNWAFNVTLCYLESIGNTTSCVTTSTRNVLIDILPPTINITSPLTHYDYLSDNQTLDLNFTVTDASEHLDSCWIDYNNDESLETFITTTNYNVSGQMAAKMNDVYYDITNYNNITINTSACELFCSSTTTYIYGNETIEIASAIGDFGYQYPVSIYKGLYNASINCSENTTFNYISNLDTLTLYANDTFGNVNSEVRSWWSKFYYNDTIFQTPVLEGISNNILTTFSSNQTLSGVYLIYGNETYTPTIYKNGNDYLLSTNVISPEIITDTNISIQGIITSNNVNYSLFNVSQEILSINLSTNCSVGTYPVLNITNYDEETLSIINGTVELLFSLSNGGSVGTISSLFNNNTIRVCSNHNLSSVNYLYSLQLRYYGSNYSYETYNILPTNTSRLPIFIPLYYMNKSIGTEFVINYKDYDYIEHPGAIIQVHRQYLTNDSYFITEIPLIDYQGQSTAMFNTNNIKYKLIIIENGKIIDYFDDIIPKCQSLVLGTCEINIRGVEVVDVTTDNTLSYNLNFTNQSIIITYIIPSGVPSTVTLETNQTSRFLSNVSSCNVSNFGSGGTLTCPYNMTVGDSVIHMIISVDGELYVEGDLYVTEDVNVWFFKNNYFIAFIIVLTLTLMFISDGAVLLIIDGLSIIFMSLIFLIRGFNFMTATSSIVWLLIAIIISIYKLSKKEDTS